MSYDLDKLEKELKAYTPRRLSLSARQSIKEKLSTPARLIPFPWAVGVASAAAVLLIALGLILSRAGSHKETRPTAFANSDKTSENIKEDVFKPVSVRSVLLDKQNEGLVLTKNKIPVRKMRYRYVDNMEWHNADRNTRFTATIPREEVVLVAAETN